MTLTVPWPPVALTFSGSDGESSWTLSWYGYHAVRWVTVNEVLQPVLGSGAGTTVYHQPSGPSRRTR